MATKEDEEVLEPFTVEVFLKAHKKDSSKWTAYCPLPQQVTNLIVEYGTGPIDTDTLERVLFYDHYHQVKDGYGIDWDQLKTLIGPNHTWPFLYSEYFEWNQYMLFGAESFRDPPAGFCSRPMCMIERCICGPDTQLPLRHVAQYVMHEGRFVYAACCAHRLEAALFASRSNK